VKSGRFHVTVRSVLAAFLFMSGLQAVIAGLREPLGSGAITAFNRLIGWIKPDSMKLNGTEISWSFFAEEIAIGLVLLILGIGIGAGVRSTIAERKGIS
jgi:hypothetical protein